MTYSSRPKGRGISPCEDPFCMGGIDSTTGMPCLLCDGNGVIENEDDDEL